MELSFTALQTGIKRDNPDSINEYLTLNNRLAYYGDISNEFLLSLNLRYDEPLDIGDRRNVLSRLASLTKKKHFGVAHYDTLPGKTALGEFAMDVLGPLLKGMGQSRKLIAKLGIELDEYWSENSVTADRIRERVRTAITDALDDSQQILLISHGTGCIFTYDVLWQLSHDPSYGNGCRDRKIDLWLTLGAPLGDSVVSSRLLGVEKKGIEQFPANIVSWHNITAEDDYVSHENQLGKTFNSMLKQKQVSCTKPSWVKASSIVTMHVNDEIDALLLPGASEKRFGNQLWRYPSRTISGSTRTLRNR